MFEIQNLASVSDGLHGICQSVSHIDCMSQTLFQFWAKKSQPQTDYSHKKL